MSTATKRSTPSPSDSNKKSVKTTKYDESLIRDIQKRIEQNNEEKEKRLNKIRIPLDIPKDDEMDRILSYFYHSIVYDPHRDFTFVRSSEQEGMYFIGEDEMEFDMDWLSVPKQWFEDHMIIVETALFTTDDERKFGDIYRKEQLHAYFISIADAWNARYTAVQLVPKLSSFYCGYETKVHKLE